MHTNLCLHSGAVAVERDDVLRVLTPAPTRSHVCVSHAYLIEKAVAWITSDDLVLLKESHALGHDGANYFGVFRVQRHGVESDHALAVGIRNSHDKTYPVGLAVGSHVFVCDNLAFSAEIVVSRRHTARVLTDIERLLAEAFGRFGELFQRQFDRFAAYKATALQPRDAHDLVIRAVDADVMPASRIPKVLTYWREPLYDDFQPRTAWSLFNAFTQDAKTWPPMELAGRTRRLHALMDHAVGMPQAFADTEDGNGRGTDSPRSDRGCPDRADYHGRVCRPVREAGRTLPVPLPADLFAAHQREGLGPPWEGPLQPPV